MEHDAVTHTRNNRKIKLSIPVEEDDLSALRNAGDGVRNTVKDEN